MSGKGIGVLIGIPKCKLFVRVPHKSKVSGDLPKTRVNLIVQISFDKMW